MESAFLTPAVKSALAYRPTCRFSRLGSRLKHLQDKHKVLAFIMSLSDVVIGPNALLLHPFTHRIACPANTIKSHA